MSAREMITVVILTRNEERNIEACIRAAKQVSDLIIVVDSGSTDKTTELAQALGARVISHELTSFAAQRNFALGLVDTPFTLFVDADERITPELADEILLAVRQSKQGCSAWRIPRREFMFGGWVNHGGWFPQYQVRLVRSDAVTWYRDVHERPHVKGRICSLRNPILHYSHLEIRDFVSKLNRYTDVERYLIRRPSLLKLVVGPWAYFVYKYVLQRGFMDGPKGLVIAGLMSFYYFVAQAKAYSLVAGWDRASRAWMESERNSKGGAELGGYSIHP